MVSRIRIALLLSALALAFLPLRAQESPSASSSSAAPVVKSRVLQVERPQNVDKLSLNAAAVAQEWHDALLAFTGKPTEAAAWQSLGIVPADTVGLKIEANGSAIMSTRAELVEAMARSLHAAGVPFDHIVVWDREARFLVGTVYEKTVAGAAWQVDRPYRVATVLPPDPGNPETGFDPKLFIINEVAGRLIWGDFLFRGKSRDQILKNIEATADDGAKKKDDASGSGPGSSADPVLPKGEIQEQISTRSYVAKLVTQVCTKIVNVPVMIDHSGYGLGGCLSSLAMGSVDNDRRFLAEGVAGDPIIGEILTKEPFRKKVVLHVMDGLIAQYAGGPAFVPQFAQSIGCLYLSNDPVAIDSLVLARFEPWRAAAKVVPIGDLAKHIKGAAAQGDGTSDPAKIDLIRIP